MNITILGAGAMGMLFGGYLSRENQVWLVDVDKARVDEINGTGIIVEEADGARERFTPKAVTTTDGLCRMDLVIVFVKSMYTGAALEANKGIIGPDTYIMTLQNGAGHEAKLRPFADDDHIIIGTTQHNASMFRPSGTRHGGSGQTSLGLLSGGLGAINHIAASFQACGFDCRVAENIRREIWTKLFTNSAASALTAILQMPLGYLTSDPWAKQLMERLCREAVAVANADCGGGFDEEETIRAVTQVCSRAKNGYTSIYTDIKNGRRTEVDTISGAVVAAAKRTNVPAPCHETVATLIHALENRGRQEK